MFCEIGRDWDKGRRTENGYNSGNEWTQQKFENWRSLINCLTHCKILYCPWYKPIQGLRWRVSHFSCIFVFSNRKCRTLCFLKSNQNVFGCSSNLACRLDLLERINTGEVAYKLLLRPFNHYIFLKSIKQIASSWGGSTLLINVKSMTRTYANVKYNLIKR